RYGSISSYAGNGGTRSMLPQSATTDGIFHMTGTQSQPAPNQKPVKFKDVIDGTSTTLLFGERTHDDGLWDSWLGATWVQPPSPPAPGGQAARRRGRGAAGGPARPRAPLPGRGGPTHPHPPPGRPPPANPPPPPPPPAGRLVRLRAVLGGPPVGIRQPPQGRSQ